MKIVMHSDEVALLTAFLSESSAYYEFGMGGSTLLAARLVRDRIHAVDSSLDWIAAVRTEIDRLSPGKQITLRHIDIGKTGGWGTPLSTESKSRFPSYSGSIVDTGLRDFDLCLVDGRFRVACFLEALSFLGPDAIIGIHDYVARPAYHVIEQFARPVASRLQLKFFVRRPNLDRAALDRMLEAHRTNWE